MQTENVIISKTPIQTRNIEFQCFKDLNTHNYNNASENKHVCLKKT